MPSGHAYAKALRTVKTCVGSEWCRFGTQDSTQMGKDLERALWRMYAPHKVKLAVSGCPRNCAEAGIKDVGVIGVDSGWEIYVAGNGGIKTEVAQFLVKLKTADEVLEYTRRLPAALPRGRLVPGAHGALRRPRRAGPREEAHPRRRRGPPGAVGAAAVQRSTASPTRGSSSTRRRSTCASSSRCAPRPSTREARMNDWTAICRVDDIPLLGARRVQRERGRRRGACSAPPTTRCSRCSTAARTRAGR